MGPSSRVLFGVALFAAIALAQTPLIQNGDFEQPVIGPPFVSSMAVPGWTHSGNTGLGNLMRVGYVQAELGIDYVTIAEGSRCSRRQGCERYGFYHRF
jgi:hypothetical protein